MMAAAAASTSGGSGVPGIPGVVPSTGNGNNGGSGGSNHGGNDKFYLQYFDLTIFFPKKIICNILIS